jgi:hypothetical protein
LATHAAIVEGTAEEVEINAAKANKIDIAK